MAKQVVSQFKHVVNIARLAGIASKMFRLIIGFKELFFIAVAASGKRMMVYDRPPEEIGNFMTLALTFEFIVTG
jgi:hypothetical protein